MSAVEVEEDDVNNNNTVSVTLKWNKKTYNDLSYHAGKSAEHFQQYVQELTGVPIERQKLLVSTKPKGYGWKGMLKLTNIMPTVDITKQPLIVTLIGSADVIHESKNPPIQFVEDLTPEQLDAAEHKQQEEALKNSHGMIPVLQKLPHERDDKKMEMYQYNRLVTGLPQRQIEKILQKQTQIKSRSDDDSNNGTTITADADATTTTTASSSSPTILPKLQDTLAMTMGFELRRAYINDMVVSPIDGTLVTANDDGHVQFWKHGALEYEPLQSRQPGGGGWVDSVVALNYKVGGEEDSPPAFATAGQGTIQLWTSDADPIIPMGGLHAPPGTSPASLIAMQIQNDSSSLSSSSSSSNHFLCLANRYRIIRPPMNPNRFRLPPQNAQERQRRLEAQAREGAIQQLLQSVSHSIQLFYTTSAPSTTGSNTTDNTTNSGPPEFEATVLEPTDQQEGAQITSLTSLMITDITYLVGGDVRGGLRIWSIRPDPERTRSKLEVSPDSFYQLVMAGNEVCSIVVMESLSQGRVAISTASLPAPSTDTNDDTNVDTTTDTTTEPNANATPFLQGSTPLEIPLAQGVHILDVSRGSKSITVLSTLNGHKDVVLCMCEIPMTGALITGGGKLDATVQVWNRYQVDGVSSSSNQEEEEEDVEDNALRRLIQTQSIRKIEQAGYVFSIKLLTDHKEGSNYIALAVARYNTVKIII